MCALYLSKPFERDITKLSFKGKDIRKKKESKVYARGIIYRWQKRLKSGKF